MANCAYCQAAFDYGDHPFCSRMCRRAHVQNVTNKRANEIQESAMRVWCRDCQTDAFPCRCIRLYTSEDIDAAVAAEREACATMVEEHGPTWGDEARDALIDAANAIRARGAKKGDE